MLLKLLDRVHTRYECIEVSQINFLYNLTGFSFLRLFCDYIYIYLQILIKDKFYLFKNDDRYSSPLLFPKLYTYLKDHSLSLRTLFTLLSNKKSHKQCVN
jgi:hypothetical protein